MKRTISQMIPIFSVLRFGLVIDILTMYMYRGRVVVYMPAKNVDYRVRTDVL